MNTPELLARRLLAQALAPSVARPTTPTTLAQAARYMIATQGQNYAGGLTALAIRAGYQETPLATNTSHLDSALENYRVIRTWSQRGTLHYLHAKDFWVVTLLGPRSIAGNIERLATAFNLDTKTYQASQGLVLDITHQPTSRDTLRARFAEAGYGRDVLSHHLRRAGSAGTIIQTRRTGQHDTFVHAARAIPEQVALAASMTVADKVRELTLRYFSTRGPATIEDFCWWSSLPKGTANKQLQPLIEAGQLIRSTFEGTDYFMGSWQLEVTQQELDHALEQALHLPAFDEYFISYKNREHLFAPGVDPCTVMTKNGISWPFLVENGLITGRS